MHKSLMNILFIFIQLFKKVSLYFLNITLICPKHFAKYCLVLLYFFTHQSQLVIIKLASIWSPSSFNFFINHIDHIQIIYNQKNLGFEIWYTYMNPVVIFHNYTLKTYYTYRKCTKSTLDSRPIYFCHIFHIKVIDNYTHSCQQGSIEGYLRLQCPTHPTMHFSFHDVLPHSIKRYPCHILQIPCVWNTFMIKTDQNSCINTKI